MMAHKREAYLLQRAEKMTLDGAGVHSSDAGDLLQRHPLIVPEQKYRLLVLGHQRYRPIDAVKGLAPQQLLLGGRTGMRKRHDRGAEVILFPLSNFHRS